MTANCKIIRIIMGSPGDLVEERARFRGIVARVIIKG